MNPAPFTTRLDAALADHTAAGLVAMAATRDGVTLELARGLRGHGGREAMTLDTVMWLASCTKPVTTVAALQCVERGLLDLDAPAARVCPEIGALKVRERFNDDGTQVLRAPRSPITLRQLLSHSSGLAYEVFHPDVARELEAAGTPNILSGSAATFNRALVADPGTAWYYSPGIDWAGRMIEQATGDTLGAFLQANVFDPLGMNDTGFALDADRSARRASMHARLPDGGLAPIPFELPEQPDFDMGGHALFSTGPDYLRFARMLLGDGRLDGVTVLKPQTLQVMRSNQIGDIAIAPIPTAAPELSHTVHLFPGLPISHGLGVLINEAPVPDGRAAGSFTWMGLSNIYFWVDPVHGVTGLLMSQLLPFYDPAMVVLYQDFERMVYRAARRS